MMTCVKEGCTVVDELEGQSWRVVRCDPDGLVLLEPVTTIGDGDNGPTDRSKQRGTRWAFHKDLRVKQVTSGRMVASHADTAAATFSPSACPTTPDAYARSCHRKMPSSTPFNPNPFARRAAKLDKRVIFRTDKSNSHRGRGLYAVKDLPKGLEVMRVRASGAVASREPSEGVCCQCIVQQKLSGRMKVCSGCGLRFCAGCAKAVEKNGAHKASCDFSAGVLRLCSGDGEAGQHDEAVLRLVADVLVRKEAGLVDGEEWDLLVSLESSDNESGSIGLSSSVLKDCVRLFDETFRIKVSEDDLQTLYRRVTRNLHTVSPVLENAGIGTALALFSCGALVNHSCQPNAFFHCLSRPTSPDGPVVENVLRTVSPVKAGEELCVSYIAHFALMSVSDRRSLLQGWDFWCACSRCKQEDAEEERVREHARPRDAEAVSWIGQLEGTIHLFAQNRTHKIGGRHYEQLNQAFQFFTEERERLSHILRRQLVRCATHLMLRMDGVDGIIKFSILRAASDEQIELRDHDAIDLRYKLYKQAFELRSIKAFFELSARKALEEAIALSELFYGKGHPRTRELVRELGRNPQPTAGC